MVLGVAEAVALVVTPTVPTAVVAGVAAAVVETVALTYGALVGATTLEVVTGLTTVQGQLVIVKVVDSVAV